jgi:hypothetical protein
MFTSQLAKFADSKTPIDLGIWLQYYAFDVVGEMTFAKKLGFLQEGRDIDGMIGAIQGMLVYASLCGQIPEMHNVLLGNPLFPIFVPSMESWNQVVQFTLKAMNSRVSLQRDGEIDQDEKDGGKDMLSRWMAMHRADPEKFSTRDAIVHLSANVFAGSDTTAIALRAILYFLMRNPDIMAKVQAEIDTAVLEGKAGNPVSYRESLDNPLQTKKTQGYKMPASQGVKNRLHSKSIRVFATRNISPHLLHTQLTLLASTSAAARASGPTSRAASSATADSLTQCLDSDYE